MSWDDHLHPWSPDPREATCVPWVSKMQHTYRDGNFYADGKRRCVHCRRVFGRRYPRPRVA